MVRAAVQTTEMRLYSVPNNKILDWSKLNSINFAGNKINMNEVLKIGLGRVENIVGKGENADYQHFLLCLLCFERPAVLGLLKV